MGWPEAIAICAACLAIAAIAKKYKVSPSTVKNIIYKRRWRYLWN